MMSMSPSHSTSPFAFSPPSLAPSSSRKRTAEAPPTSPISPSHSTKKRRPNLANGLSGLSISPRVDRLSPSPIPSYEESEATKHEVDEDDGLARTRFVDEDSLGSEGVVIGRHERDVHVEELPDRSTSGWTRSSITSSSTSSTEDQESDSTFRPLQRPKRRFARVAQQADQVEHPDEAGPSNHIDGRDVQVEDVSYNLSGRKREGYETEQLARRKRRKRSRADGDMDMDTSGDEEDIQEIRPTARRKRKTRWHEPEKDRIVITSLGSSDSETSPEPRSPSPNTKRMLLSQPGAQGFTMSPSLLTHLLSSNTRDQILRPPIEKGMVLYRPPANFGQYPGSQIVHEWNGEPKLGEEPSRFEEIDDDEDVTQGQPASVGLGDVSMDVEDHPGVAGQDYGGDVDMSMDLE